MISCNYFDWRLSNIPLVSVNMEEGVSCYLDDIAANIECCNLDLPIDYYFGEIIDIQQCCDSLLLFHDYYTKQIHIFTTKGKFVNVLNKIGRGPEEYIDIEAFSVNEKRNHLIIYDHQGQCLIEYSLPDLTFVRRNRINKSLMGLTILSDNLYFTISDEDKGPNSVTCDGAETYDLSKKEFKSCELPDNYVSINLSYPRTSSRTDNANYYISPHFYSVVYELNTKYITPVLKLHFGSKNIPKKLWKTNDVIHFEEVVENNEYAFMPHYFLKQDSSCSFFVYNGGIEEDYLIVTEMKNNAESKVFKEIKLKGIEMLSGIRPLGVCAGKYVCLLYPYQCDETVNTKDLSPITQIIKDKLSKSPDEGTPILLFFEPKFLD